MDYSNSKNFEHIPRILNKVYSRRSLADAPPLMCPRYDEPPGDDMDETEQPLGWNELTRAEKCDILDYEMDLYWNEIIPPINFWKITTYVLLFINFMYILSL